MAEIFKHLNNEEDSSVVLTNSYWATRLTMYTEDFVYSGGYDATFAVPKERLAHDYFVLLALRGVSPGESRAYMSKSVNRHEIASLLFIGTYWRDLCGSYECFPDSVIDELVKGYGEFSIRPLAEAIRDHRIDYILWDSKQEPGWQLKGLVQDLAAVTSGDFRLYRLVRSH
jgi:hypothetical protein